MAFTVRAAEHLSCTETFFPRMRDRGSLLLRQADPLTVFRPPGRRCRMPVGKECLQGAVCREGCLGGRFRTASATAHRKERCDLLRTNVRHCRAIPPVCPPCGARSSLGFRLSGGGSPHFAAGSCVSAAVPHRRTLRVPYRRQKRPQPAERTPGGRDLRRRINRSPHGSEEPQSAAAFRNRPDSLSGLYEKSYSSETDAGVAADEWRPARSKGAANLRFAGCRFADGGGIVKRDEKTIPLRRVLAGIACFGACGFGSTVPCSAEKSTCFSAGSYRVCLLSECAASARRCRAARKKHLFLRRSYRVCLLSGCAASVQRCRAARKKAPVSPPDHIGCCLCRSVRLRLFRGVGRRTSRWCGCVPRTRRARWCCGT